MLEDSTDRAAFLDPEDFGELATVAGVPDVPCIFQGGHSQALGIDGTRPVLWCRSADVPGVEHGAAVTVDGRSWTAAADPHHDGKGMATIPLELQP